MVEPLVVPIAVVQDVALAGNDSVIAVLAARALGAPPPPTAR
jgi:hypothetical protein